MVKGKEHRVLVAIEERVAHLEGRITEQSQVFDDMRRTLADLRQTVRDVDERVSRNLMWTVGIQVTTLLTIIALLRH